MPSRSVGAPAVPAIAVPRDELVERLDTAAQRQLTVIVAPAGSGKSVLLGQWAAANPDRRVAWLTLDPGDDDASRFARYLCAALGRLQAGLGARLRRHLKHRCDHLGPAFVDAVLEELREMAGAVIVVDDFHLLGNGSLMAEVRALVECSPPHIHFVIASRTDPQLQTSRLRLRDEFRELRQPDLAFDHRNEGELIRRVSRAEVSDTQVHALIHRTEGWATGLQLAALSLRAGAGENRLFVDSFDGADPLVAGYLTEQVMIGQPPDVERFLLYTSVLERLGAPLCDAVTGGHDGQAMLELIDGRSLFVSRLDSRYEWFRYHHLFRTLLLQRLRLLQPDLENELLRRAAEWHLGRGDVETGVGYLMDAGAWEQVLSTAKAHGVALSEQGRVGTVIGWLDSLPPRLRSRDDVALFQARLHLMAGGREQRPDNIGPIRTATLASAERPDRDRSTERGMRPL